MNELDIGRRSPPVSELISHLHFVHWDDQFFFEALLDLRLRRLFGPGLDLHPWRFDFLRPYLHDLRERLDLRDLLDERRDLRERLDERDLREDDLRARLDLREPLRERFDERRELLRDLRPLRERRERFDERREDPRDELDEERRDLRERREPFFGPGLRTHFPSRRLPRWQLRDFLAEYRFAPGLGVTRCEPTLSFPSFLSLYFLPLCLTYATVIFI